MTDRGQCPFSAPAEHPSWAEVRTGRADLDKESGADSDGGNLSIAPWVNPKSRLVASLGFWIHWLG